VPISNHAKTFIVDDKVFYIGSQNQYASNLNEFGYIVEDAVAAANYVARYWTPLWQYSSVTLTQAYDEDVEVTAQMEAMQFILALDQNTRMNVIWSDLLARYQNEAGTTKDATGKLMDDLIVSGGFATTLANVLAGLRTPFFTETPPDTQASGEALRFVANLMTSPGLMKGFSDAVQAPADSVQAANQAITDFLQKNGYGCTALQVLAAFAAMRRKVLAYWAGNYTSWVTPDGGAAYTLNTTSPTRRLLAADAPAPAVPALGPALVIGGDGSVTFDGSQIVDPLYNDNTLSWIAGSGNATAATLKFGTVTRAGILDDFSGNECFGTVTFPLNAPQSGVCSFYARNTDPAPANANDAGKQSSTVFYVLGAVAVAALLMLLAYCAFRSRAKQFKYARIAREKRQADLDESEIELEPVQSRGRQVETDLLVMEQVQRRVSLQRDSLMELVKYEGSMTTTQRMGLADSATKLNETAGALRNPTAEALHDVVATQARSVATIQETITGIAKESRAKISGESADLIEDNAKLSNEAAATIEDYQKDQENDQPFEEDVL